MGKPIAKFIRSARERAGLTQLELAKAMGYSVPQFVSNWERGVSVPPLESARKLARLLDVSPAELAHAFARDALEDLAARREAIDRALLYGR